MNEKLKEHIGLYLKNKNTSINIRKLALIFFGGNEEVEGHYSSIHKLLGDHFGVYQTYHKEEDGVEIWQWYYMGVRHSINGGYSKFNWDPEKNIKTWQWQKYGLIHRSGDRPAIKKSNGDIKYFKWGKLHRDGDKPAVIEYSESPEDFRIKKLSWYKNDKEHRDNGKPSTIILKEHEFNSNKILKRLVWNLNGDIHRDGDRPAIIEYEMEKDTKEKRIVEAQYLKHGVRHRDGDKPALIDRKRDKDNVNKTEFSWIKYGKLHRDGDKPACIDLTNRGKRQEWKKNGECYREGDKPSIIEDNGDKIWMTGGCYSRENGKPAYISNKDIKRKEWWVMDKIICCMYPSGVIEYGSEAI